MRKKLTLTVFSAPNYCDTYKNKGGIAIINVLNNLSIEKRVNIRKLFAKRTPFHISQLHERARMVVAFNNDSSIPNVFSLIENDGQ
jgi:hypothetical protein